MAFSTFLIITLLTIILLLLIFIILKRYYPATLDKINNQGATNDKEDVSNNIFSTTLIYIFIAWVIIFFTYHIFFT